MSEDKHVAGWANSSSALGVFAIGYEPLAFADGAHQFEDPACPVTSDDGTTVTIRGGCTDNKGTTWAGTATTARDGTARRITDRERARDRAALQRISEAIGSR